MSKGLYKDFDAVRREQRGEPIGFRINGEEFALPPALPALVMLKAVELMVTRAGEEEIAPAELVDMLRGIFGHDQLERLLKSTNADGVALSMDDLSEVLTWAIQAYRGETGDEGN